MKKLSTLQIIVAILIGTIALITIIYFIFKYGYNIDLLPIILALLGIN